MLRAIPSKSLEDMRRMKSLVKERLASYDSDLTKRRKDVLTLKQSMDKAEQAFFRTQSDMHAAHAQSLDRAPRRSFSWTPIRNESKDQLFERIQRLTSELARTSTESDLEFNQLSTKHLSAYNRFTVVMNELASMRRRINRRIAHEINSIVPKLDQGLQAIFAGVIPPMLTDLDRVCNSSGDFGMRLCSVDESLRSIVGEDRTARLQAMRDMPEVFEYRAIQSYLAKEAGELSFNRNEVVKIIRKDASGWWYGANQLGDEGLFPSVLVAQRPAGASLPLQQVPAVSYRPNVTRGDLMGTWNSVNTVDSRIQVLKNEKMIGIVQFAFHGDDGISVEPGEIVQVIAANEDSKSVKVIKKGTGQTGSVPLNILILKHTACNENEINASNW